VPRPEHGIYEATRFGAVPDGKGSSTRGLQAAIDACGGAGGGMVLVPPGRYVSGALFLRSHVELRLARGATLVGSPRFEDYPSIQGRWEGVERPTHSSLLTGIGVEDVTISGEGTLDGQGAAWWEASSKTRAIRVARNISREAENPADAPLRWPCPRLINLVRCQNVLVSGVALVDSPSVTIHLIYCQEVLIRSIKIGVLQALGVDGIIIDSSQRVRIMQCLLECGDCVSIKSGYNEDGRRVGLASEDILVSNCTLLAGQGSGLALGSETAGGIRNVTFTNCVVTKSRHGVYVRSPRGRGGGVERLRVSNVVYDGLTERAIRVCSYYDSIKGEGVWAKPAGLREGGYYPTAVGNRETDRSLLLPVDEGTPLLRDFEFTGITIGKADGVAYLEGLPERFITDVRICDVSAPLTKTGIFCARVSGLSVDRLTVGKLQGPILDAHQVERLEVHRLRCAEPAPAVPVIRMDAVAGALVHGCDVPVPPDRFVALQGPDNHQVHLETNRLAG
jgi:hypothetical protein